MKVVSEMMLLQGCKQDSKAASKNLKSVYDMPHDLCLLDVHVCDSSASAAFRSSLGSSVISGQGPHVASICAANHPHSE